MTKRNDGGPVFPAYTGNPDHWQFGMSFRDAAALAALTGLVQRCETNERGIFYQPKILARNAYVLADAMIEARGK